MASRQEVLNNDYNPYINRQRKEQSGNLSSLVNLIKCLLGNGILAMPKAFDQAGLFIGLFLTIAIVSLITYCLHIMFQNMHFLCKRDNVPYISLSMALKESFLVGPNCLKVLAPFVPFAVNILIIIFQFGVCCVYVVFCAKNIKTVVDDNTSEESHLSLLVYMTMFYIPILLLVYIKNLKKMAPILNLGNFFTLISLVIIYVFVFENMGHISDRSHFGKPVEYPLFMGTIMYSVLAVGAILSIEYNMKHAENFVSTFGVLNQGMFIALFLNGFTGFFGYWKYGKDVESSITLNLGKNGYAWAVHVMFSLIMLLSLPLQSYPATEIIWNNYVAKHMTESKHKTLWDYCIRTTFITATYLVAIPLPFLGKIISLVGAFCLTILGIIVPALIDICLRWYKKEFGKTYIYLIRDIFILAFGVCGFVTGTYAPIAAIIAELKSA